ncbi:hypothetical protein DMX06_14645 [Pseudomonas mosselii]|nr:hypothetical protein DMX06_14645 [Pseudomonas mosselii]
MSRKGCEAAPGFQLRRQYCRGRCAALSRHKAAPTGDRVYGDRQARQSLDLDSGHDRNRCRTSINLCRYSRFGCKKKLYSRIRQPTRRQTTQKTCLSRAS